jgi:hypothetical protein
MRLKQQWKRYGLAILIFLSAGLCIGCATTAESGLTAELMAAEGIDEARVRRGRALAVTGCAECHRFYWPHEYSPEEWPGIVKKMGNRSALDSAQTADVELYFVTTSRALRKE